MADRRIAGARILMTADTVGGVFTYALTLSEQLLRRGASVDLATMGLPLRAAQRAAVAAIPGLAVHESTYALEWMQDASEDVERAGEWLLALERRLSPDIVHLNGYCHGAIGFRAPVVVVAHSCVSSWWEAVFGGDPPPSFDWYRTEVTRGLAAADAVLAPTAWMMRALERHYGQVRFGVVVPNGASPPARAMNARRTTRAGVLAAGRLWDRAKNLTALAAVAPRLSAPVRLAGCEQHPDGSSALLANVQLLGWLDGAALEREMDSAAVFVHPARYEPFGLAPLEAALHECALVLGDIESLREIWGDAAVYVDPDDTEALRTEVERYLHDEELRRCHAARAAARAVRFTAEGMADATADVYARLLRGHLAASELPARRRASSCA